MGAAEQQQIGVVVARYAEDVAWLAKLGLPGVVYNKGPELPAGILPPGVRIAALPNIGREAHTYLAHIIANYAALPAHTAFLQGDPFAHLTPPDEPRLSPTGLGQRLRQLAAADTPFAGLAWFRLRCDGQGRPHDLADPAKKGRWKGWGRDIPVAATFTALFDAPAPRAFIARAATGNMLVRRDRILARPLAFYERALALILADPDDAWNTGHAFERLWQAVFSGAGAPAGPRGQAE
ncbi:MAG: hypothetical protein AUJ49_07120 [Desulfovibrionaceae bacterium CG1_02_65_16]|nr:MAG: hypothetical protein AUJ49_07120 [Desulfovibrionaceae bacterium CG1_02_65_16]